MFKIHIALIYEKYKSIYPMLLIHVFICVPLSSEEGILPTDDLSVKESGHCRKLLC